MSVVCAKIIGDAKSDKNVNRFFMSRIKIFFLNLVKILKRREDKVCFPIPISVAFLSLHLSRF